MLNENKCSKIIFNAFYELLAIINQIIITYYATF